MISKVECSFNIITDKIEKCYRNIFIDSSIEELKKKDSIILLRSAKEDVLCSFLTHINEAGYAGKLYLIGRESDRQYLEKYRRLNISLFVVDEGQQYTVENTYEHIQRIKADAICFLYQKVISKGYENIFNIINLTNCVGYAISNKLKVVKLVKLYEYLEGIKIYSTLCDWFYRN